MIPKVLSHKGARIVLAIVALLVLIGGIDRGRAWLAHRAQVFDIERLHSRVIDLRSDVESCRAALDREHAGFERYRASVDSLREAIRGYEALDERGVPADRYDAYMETFRSYNQSLPGWRARADSLAAHDDICRDLTVEHNALAESLRVSLEAAGVSSVSGDGAYR